MLLIAFKYIDPFFQRVQRAFCEKAHVYLLDASYMGQQHLLTPTPVSQGLVLVSALWRRKPVGPQSNAAMLSELGDLLTVSQGSLLFRCTQLPFSLLLTQQSSSGQTQEACQTVRDGTLRLHQVWLFYRHLLKKSGDYT